MARCGTNVRPGRCVLFWNLPQRSRIRVFRCGRPCVFHVFLQSLEVVPVSDLTQQAALEGQLRQGGSSSRKPRDEKETSTGFPVTVQDSFLQETTKWGLDFRGTRPARCARIHRRCGRMAGRRCRHGFAVEKPDETKTSRFTA